MWSLTMVPQNQAILLPEPLAHLPLRLQRCVIHWGEAKCSCLAGPGKSAEAASSVPRDGALGCCTGLELREFGAGLGRLLPTHQRATSALCCPRRALNRLCPLFVPLQFLVLLLQGCPACSLMAGDLTYADLRFARSPPEKSHGEEPNDGELTYENFQVPRGLEKEAAECGPLKNTPELPCWATSCHRWRPVTNRPMLGALALCLFLLATNITLGVQYLQASRQLQQASRDHAAKSHILGERTHHLQAGLEESWHLLRLTEQELNSTKKELNSTKVALWQSQAAENQTRWKLQRQELLLGQANSSLALLQREKASLETHLSQATSCRQIGCCPRGWTLFRWKCLWASSERKTWSESKLDCERKSSRLLVLPKPWSARELWEAVGEAFTQK
ncbi:B-cell differentiation antigen CD72 isoform X2 [Pantherophis guttatus]|uniref:B-cell differentiation antigen CD72 isoform X2 n=1 Tax=Pantherophis guttatus TaxID=94885 RepID=A0A6P9E3A9_PANGU|nr:B-cell differentiation antigen CD72 isoform X2 [Pantherophis guttatus]